MKRSSAEKAFLVFFLPVVLLVYVIKAYPGVVTGPLGIEDPFGTFFFLFGKSPNFWYQTAYTVIISAICLGLLLRGKSPYGNKRGREGLSGYQRKKFTCILLVQFVGFYFFPFVMPMVKSGQWADAAKKNKIQVTESAARFDLQEPISYSPTNPKYELLAYVDGELITADGYSIENKTSKTGSTLATAVTFNQPVEAGSQVIITAFHQVHKMAHVYVSPQFFSGFAFLYMFVIIPVFVWFFGKRYCSWVCACGNLAEAIGTTKWGAKWVKEGTPRGKKSVSLEWIQVIMLVFSVVVGLSAILNVYHIISPGAYHRLWYLQDFITDFTFGSVIGVGLYPFFGTRIWCRYGCPMARWMKLFGRWGRSTFAVVPDDNCIAIGACTDACPMGIPVADFAHKDKKPIEMSFGLESTPCIGCGGCVDSCPTNALSFQKISKPLVPAADETEAN
ncbi:MAG: ferredoxin [Rhodothermales bacterium]|jgi:ferredoxin